MSSMDYCIRQAHKATFKLRCIAKKWHKSSLDLLLDFQALVEPVLLYGCESWGYSNISKIEVFYNKFYKQTLHLKPSTPTFMWCIETGTWPCRQKIDKRILSFWASLYNNELISPKLAKEFLINSRQARFKTWNTYLRDIMMKYDLMVYYNSETVNSRTAFLNTVQSRINLYLKTEYLRSLNESSKCKYYSLLVNELDFGKKAWYLSNVDTKNLNTLCRFRLH